MQFERTNGRCEDLAGELSFHCRISLHFAPSWLGGFIRLGQGASAPQTEGMSVGGRGRREAGSPEETPAIISLVASRYQKNIQIWEKTYPECRGWRWGGMEGGDSLGALRIRTSSRPPRRAQRGGRRRPAARVASLRTRSADARVSFQSFASLLASLGFRHQ